MKNYYLLIVLIIACNNQKITLPTIDSTPIDSTKNDSAILDSFSPIADAKKQQCDPLNPYQCEIEGGGQGVCICEPIKDPYVNLLFKCNETTCLVKTGLIDFGESCTHHGVCPHHGFCFEVCLEFCNYSDWQNGETTCSNNLTCIKLVNATYNEYQLGYCGEDIYNGIQI